MLLVIWEISVKRYEKVMRKVPSKSIVQVIAIALLFLLLGHGFILQRTSSNPSKPMTIRGDTNAYVSMIRGNWTSPPSPFKFRVLVPFLASLLPLSPTDALRFISYISLFLCYVFMLLTCAKLGLSTSQSAVGLLAAWAST